MLIVVNKSRWIVVLVALFLLIAVGCEPKESTTGTDAPGASSASETEITQSPVESIEETEVNASTAPARSDENTEDENQQQEKNIQQDDSQNDAMPYDIDILVDGVNVPWDMDIAYDGSIYFTERPGNIRVVDADGTLREKPIFQFSAPFISKSEGGLLGIVLDPDFEHNHYIYVYHTYQENKAIKNRVLRLVVEGDKAAIDKVLIDNIPGASNHNGGRIKIGPDGYLYITAGDRYEPSLAQDVHSLGGKILRIGLDGSIPADNPIAGSPIYSMGHRNAQGLAWHPVTGQLFSSEHGQTAHDEINIIEAGENYGWPIIEGDKTSQKYPQLKTPLIHSGDITWAPSGMTFVSKGPWKGKLLVANLRGTQVLKITLDPNEPSQVTNIEFLFQDWGRIRNVYEGADGTLYIMTNNRDGRGKPQKNDDKIYRLRLHK